VVTAGAPGSEAVGVRIAWVQQSWRDLVIDRLADDAAARREFLAACGIEGALLALSTGGGRAGERMLPLLREDADWDAFGGGLHVLARDADDPCLVRLLGALATALAARVDAERRGELAALARTVLEDVRDRWDAGHRPLVLPPLEAWFDAASHLQPPPRPPDVAPTWFELLPAPDLPDLDDMVRAADWLALMELLGRYDPTRLLRLGGTERMHAVVEAARNRIAGCSGPKRAALMTIMERAARLGPADEAFAVTEWDLTDPSSPWADPPGPSDEVLAAYGERRLIERVLHDL
jgi:hypothetical protein